MSNLVRRADTIPGWPLIRPARVRRPAMAEEGEKLAKYQEQVSQDIPDLRRQGQTTETELRLTAMRETAKPQSGGMPGLRRLSRQPPQSMKLFPGRS